jgi:hypothetical protein
VHEGDEAVIPEPLNFNDILPLSTNLFYRYFGSLTTPTCDEIVTWTLFATPALLSSKQVRSGVTWHQLETQNFSPSAAEWISPINQRRGAASGQQRSTYSVAQRTNCLPFPLNFGTPWLCFNFCTTFFRIGTNTFVWMTQIPVNRSHIDFNEVITLIVLMLVTRKFKLFRLDGAGFHREHAHSHGRAKLVPKIWTRLPRDQFLSDIMCRKQLGASLVAS